MANKQGSLLMTLGKRMLGFSTSSSGCCAGPAAADGKAPETATDTVASPKPGEGSARGHKLLLDCSRGRARQSFCMSGAAPGRSGASARPPPAGPLLRHAESPSVTLRA